MIWLVWSILIFALPVAITISFIVSLVRYIKAMKTNKQNPNAIPLYEVKNRLTILIIFSVLMGLLVAIVIGFVILINLAIAFM